MTILKGKFDVQIDSNHRWDEDRIMEIDAYPLIQLEDGSTETDITQPLASVRVPAFDVHMDTWIASTEKKDIEELPILIRAGYRTAVTLAMMVQKEKI